MTSFRLPCVKAHPYVRVGGQSVSTRAKLVGECAELGQETLHVLGGFEVLQNPFPLPGREVGVFDAIGESFLTTVSAQISAQYTSQDTCGPPSRNTAPRLQSCSISSGRAKLDGAEWATQTALPLRGRRSMTCCICL
jgi:hypothetical protein